MAIISVVRRTAAGMLVIMENTPTGQWLRAYSQA
jgi:hypothetical protein